MKDYLEDYKDKIALDEIKRVREERAPWMTRKGALPFLGALESIPAFKTGSVDIAGDVVTIGRKDELSDEGHELLDRSLKTLLPWRKGPFNLFGHYIDSEWRSNMKWDRISPHILPLKGKKVADIGCGNGYYMFRMASQNPKMVIGMDPMPRFRYQFMLMNRFAGFDNIHFELLGAEHVRHFNSFFDTVFCMGVLYHNRNPIQILTDIWECMKKDGQLILESQGIPGDGSYAIFPEDRYAKMRNVWFFPTAECLVNWVKKAGFYEVECFSIDTTGTDEQRATELAPWESLSDFLDPHDPSKTVEGYPAPVRICIKARKKTN